MILSGHSIILFIIIQLLSCVWLWPHGLQNSWLPCPSLCPTVCSYSCALSRWCHPTISFCQPILLLPSAFPSIRVFSNELALCIRWPNIRAPASTSVFPINIQVWFLLGLTSLFSLLSKGLSIVVSSTTVQKPQFLGAQSSLWPNSHICTWLLEKIRVLTLQTFFSKLMSLLFNMLSRFIIVLLSRSKHLLVSWLQSPSTVILEPKKIKSVTALTFSPFICYDVMRSDAMFLIFLMLSYKPELFHSPLSPSSS